MNKWMNGRAQLTKADYSNGYLSTPKSRFLSAFLHSVCVLSGHIQKQIKYKNKMVNGGVSMCNWSQVKMEQGAKGLSQWHVALHQFTETRPQDSHSGYWEVNVHLGRVFISRKQWSAHLLEPWPIRHSTCSSVHRAGEDRLGLCRGTQAECQWNGATLQYVAAWPQCELLPSSDFHSFPDDLHSGNVSFPARNDDFQGAPGDALRRAQDSRGGPNLWWKSKDAPQGAASLTCQWNPNDVPHQKVNNALFWPPNSNF